MLGKSIFARRAAHPATAPSSQVQPGPAVSSPSTFGQKFRKLKQVFKRSSPREKDIDAPQSITHPQDLQATARPQQPLKATTSTHTSQGPYAMTQRDLASFDPQPRGPYLTLPPALGHSPLFQSGEEAFATSSPSTAPRPTSAANPSLLALPQSGPTAVRSPHPSGLFQPEEEISAISTHSTASRPTLSGNPSHLRIPSLSFDTTPITAFPPCPSPRPKPRGEPTATSILSATPCPTVSPNPSLPLPAPQSAGTTPTTLCASLSPTSQYLEQTIEDPAATEKIANLRATIQELQLERDNFLAAAQGVFTNTVDPGLEDFRKKRDVQVAALQRAKAALATKVETRKKMDLAWRDRRDQRCKLQGAALELDQQRKVKEMRCMVLQLEVHRLYDRQQQSVARASPRQVQDRELECHSEPRSGVSAESRSASPTSFQESLYACDFSVKIQPQGGRATAPISEPTKSAKQGPFAVGPQAPHRAPTQDSHSTKFNMNGEAVRTDARARTSQRTRGTLGESGRGSEGLGSRGESNQYPKDFA
ncbi:hypothetical protein FRC01_000001 [Tulasnella sp. 417]|nr:hypothetical protein FRC01_000001 [Tulasnella sp. 417]